VTFVHLKSKLFYGYWVEEVGRLSKDFTLLVGVLLVVTFVRDARKDLSLALVKNLCRQWNIRADNINKLDNVAVDACDEKVDELDTDDISHLLDKDVGLLTKVDGKDVV